MKQKLLFLFALLTISNIGFVNSQTLYVPEATGTTPGLYKSTNGNVGIGTTSTPGEKLEINGNLKFTNNSSKIFLGSNDYIQFTDGTNDGYKFIYDNVERLRITNIGNVGIGTNNPNAKLSIYRTAGLPSIKAADEGGGQSGYVIIDGFKSGNRIANAVSLNHYIDGNVLLAIGGGNVGIGTDNPNAKLSIFRTAGLPSIKAADEGGGQSGYVIIDGYKSGNRIANAVSLNHYIDGDVWLANGGGNVGIGTDNPNAQLHLTSDTDHSLRISRTSGMYGFRIFRNATEGNIYFQNTDNNNNFGTRIKISEGGAYWQNLMLNPDGGNVLIGKTTQINNTYKLDVTGKIRADEIVVNTTGADFVFAPTYKLRPLSEVASFIKQHQHLPEIAPASEMQENGVSVSEMQTKLLQKVEETTLYLIEQAKQIESLKKENEHLKAENEKQLEDQYQILLELKKEMELLKNK